MSYAELATIVGKTKSAAEKAFSRRGWTIHNPQHIQSYLALVFGQAKRAKRPKQTGEHLRTWQYRRKQKLVIPGSTGNLGYQAVPETISKDGKSLSQTPLSQERGGTQGAQEMPPIRPGNMTLGWADKPRLYGTAQHLSPARLEELRLHAETLFLGVADLDGVIFAGAGLEPGTPELRALAVFASSAPHPESLARADRIAENIGKTFKQQLKLLPIGFGALPSTLAHEGNAELKNGLQAGRVEFGWVSLVGSWSSAVGNH